MYILFILISVVSFVVFIITGWLKNYKCTYDSEEYYTLRAINDIFGIIAILSFVVAPLTYMYEQGWLYKIFT